MLVSATDARRDAMISAKRRTAALLLAAVMLLLAGCTSEHPTPPTVRPVPTEGEHARLRPPTAEQAYRLQDDCSHRGEAILRDNSVGSALTQEQVSRYNAVTNRCYVRLEVHARNLGEWEKHDNSTYLKDGQTGELLAFITIKPGGAKSFLGFGCTDFDCVATKIAACMAGKECEPE
jgi:hypothetical protein